MEPVGNERFTCPKWNGWGKAGSHYWHKRDGFRCCSHCGSIHPDEWIEAVRESVVTGGRVNIDRGKRGKWYLTDRRTSGRRGKFYGDHMPEEQRADPALSDQLHRAIRASWDRMFQKRDQKSAVERLGDVADGG